MQRGNSSSVRDLQRLPTPNITDLEVGARCAVLLMQQPLPCRAACVNMLRLLQVGLPDAAGSSGKAEVHNESQDRKQDKCPNVDPALQQLQQLKNNFDAAKAQHRLQLQERNRQIGHLQEDRERARKLLKKAEGDVRSAFMLFILIVCLPLRLACLATYVVGMF